MEKTKTLTKKALATMDAPEGRTFIAVAAGRWERRTNALEAVEAVRKRVRGRVVVFDVSATTVVSDMGTFQHWPPAGRTWDDATPEESREWKRSTEVGTFGR